MSNDLLYSNDKEETHEEGIGFYIEPYANGVLEFEAVRPRMARIRLKARWFNLTGVTVHTTEVVNDDTKDSWYGNLPHLVDGIPRHDLLLIQGGLLSQFWVTMYTVSTVGGGKSGGRVAVSTQLNSTLSSLPMSPLI